MLGPKVFYRPLMMMSLALTLVACGGGSSSPDPDPVATVNGSPETDCDAPWTELSGAFLEFVMAPNLDIVLSADGCTVALESDGMPDHSSAYWDPNGANSNLWVEAEDPSNFGDPGENPSGGQASPGYIDNYINDYDLTVSIAP